MGSPAISRPMRDLVDIVMPAAAQSAAETLGLKVSRSVTTGVRVRRISREDAEIAVECLRDWGFSVRITGPSPADGSPPSPEFKRAALHELGHNRDKRRLYAMTMAAAVQSSRILMGLRLIEKGRNSQGAGHVDPSRPAGGGRTPVYPRAAHCRESKPIFVVCPVPCSHRPVSRGAGL